MALRKLFLLFLVLVVASFFRLHNLDSIPSGLYHDEAINGNDALSEPGKLFYSGNNGREGLFINLLALSFSIFGISVYSLRLVSALAGILTVLGTFLFAKEILLLKYTPKKAEFIALLSSFFLALSFWHINFSRIGFRAGLMTLLLVFSFYFITKGFKSKKNVYLIVAGIIFGLGFYTYTIFRLAVLLLGLILALWWIIYKTQKQQKKFFSSCAILLSSIFASALPIGIYFLQNPKDFMGRAGEVSIFHQPNLLEAFSISVIKHLGMFNISGDTNWRHNISGAPELFWPIGILFLIGLALSIIQLIKSIKNKDYSLFVLYGSILGWFALMMLPGILTFESIPHSLRCIGATPAIFILAGIGGEFLYAKIKKRKDIFVSICLIILMSSLIYAQYYRYFKVWAENEENPPAFNQLFVDMGNYLNTLPAGTEKYVIVNANGVPVKGIPMPAQTIMFIERTKFGTPQATYLLPQELDRIKINNAVIIPMKYSEELFEELKQKFPAGYMQKTDKFWIFKIN